MNRLIAAGAMALVLVAGCGAPSSTASPAASLAPASTAPASAASAAAATAVAVTLQDFKIDVTTMSVPGNVEFNVHSNGPTPHNFTIRDSAGQVVLMSKDLHTGDSHVVTGQLAAGSYTFFCAFAGHESLGMHGTLTVTP